MFVNDSLLGLTNYQKNSHSYSSSVSQFNTGISGGVSIRSPPQLSKSISKSAGNDRLSISGFERTSPPKQPHVAESKNELNMSALAFTMNSGSRYSSPSKERNVSSQVMSPKSKYSPMKTNELMSTSPGISPSIVTTKSSAIYRHSGEYNYLTSSSYLNVLTDANEKCKSLEYLLSETAVAHTKLIQRFIGMTNDMQTLVVINQRAGEHTEAGMDVFLAKLLITFTL